MSSMYYTLFSGLVLEEFRSSCYDDTKLQEL